MSGSARPQPPSSSLPSLHTASRYCPRRPTAQGECRRTDTRPVSRPLFGAAMSGTTPDAPATIGGHIRGSGRAKGGGAKAAVGASREMCPAHFFWEKGRCRFFSHTPLRRTEDSTRAAVAGHSPELGGSHDHCHRHRAIGNAYATRRRPECSGLPQRSKKRRVSLPPGSSAIEGASRFAWRCASGWRGVRKLHGRQKCRCRARAPRSAGLWISLGPRRRWRRMRVIGQVQGAALAKAHHNG